MSNTVIEIEAYAAVVDSNFTSRAACKDGGDEFAVGQQPRAWARGTARIDPRFMTTGVSGQHQCATIMLAEKGADFVWALNVEPE